MNDDDGHESLPSVYSNKSPTIEWIAAVLFNSEFIPVSSELSAVVSKKQTTQKRMGINKRTAAAAAEQK